MRHRDFNARASVNCVKSNDTCNVSGSGNTLGGWDVYDNQWNCGSGAPVKCGPESIHVCTASSWYVESNQPMGKTAVLSYPAVQENFGSGNGTPIASFNNLTSTFVEVLPHVTGGDYEMTYDIWINGIGNPPTSTEVMIWVENYNQTPFGSKMTTATFGSQSWDVWVTSDKSGIAFVANPALTSGTVDILQMFKWIIMKGWMSGSSSLYQIGFGPEICSTGGQNATFYIDDYSITAN